MFYIILIIIYLWFYKFYILYKEHRIRQSSSPYPAQRKEKCGDETIWTWNLCAQYAIRTYLCTIMVEFYLKELVSAASEGLERLLCDLPQKLLRINLRSSIWFLSSVERTNIFESEHLSLHTSWISWPECPKCEVKYHVIMIIW